MRISALTCFVAANEAIGKKQGIIKSARDHIVARLAHTLEVDLNSAITCASDCNSGAASGPAISRAKILGIRREFGIGPHWDGQTVPVGMVRRQQLAGH